MINIDRHLRTLQLVAEAKRHLTNSDRDSKKTLAFFNEFKTSIQDVNGVRNIYAEIPGFSKEDVNITVKRNILKIQGKSKAFNEFIGERSLNLAFELPSGNVRYDLKKITASVENGILHVLVPFEKPIESEETIIKIK